MRELAPCSGCLRHVHVDDAACPFCLLPLVAASVLGRGESRWSRLQRVPSGLSRSALYALSSALLCQTACEGGQTSGAPAVSEPPTLVGATEVAPTAPLILQPTVTSATAPEREGCASEDCMMQALYGAPPFKRERRKGAKPSKCGCDPQDPMCDCY